MQDKLKLALDIGEEMLSSGAEVHRVEDSLNRILSAFGAKRADVFIITTSMIVSITTSAGEVITQTRRIGPSGMDFDKLHKLNALSRRICGEQITCEEIKRELDAIKPSKTYPLWVEFICYAVIAGAFTMFFGGNWAQAIVSLVIGIGIRVVLLIFDKTVKNRIFSKFIASFLATALAYISVKLGLAPGPDEIIIGNIMVLIPGIGLTNSLRDVFTGDSITGLLRFIEALLIALAIAAGFFVYVVIFGGAA